MSVAWLTSHNENKVWLDAPTVGGEGQTGISKWPADVVGSISASAERLPRPAVEQKRVRLVVLIRRPR